MKTMGLASLSLVNPERFPDAEADARASGALDVLRAATVCSSLDEALAGCVLAAATTARPRDLSPRVVPIREAAKRLLETANTDEVSLVFGTENSGLTSEEVMRCQMVVHIPTSSTYSSLNLACAVQVMCYEMRMALSMAERAEKSIERARLDDVERFFSTLEQTLVEIDFLDPHAPKRLMPRLRRLFTKADVEKEELNILMGILRKLRSHRP
jgi:tRNA/rRNA methyltransferase